MNKKIKKKAKAIPQDKSGQNKTISKPKVNPQTGLTPQQEQCASLLASGEKVSKVADLIQVSRTTIYQWNDLITFQCFTNQLRDEMQRHLNQSLLKMAGEALSTIQKSLTSENESLRVKSAIWLLDRINKVEVGECNPFEVIRKEATTIDPLDWDKTPSFNKNVYEKKLKELGLVECHQHGKLYENEEELAEVADMEIDMI